MGRWIDLDTWNRREHFHLYRRFADPFFSLCAELDTTGAWRRSVEPGGPSFILSAMFCALGAMNEVEAMRLRIRGDRVWLHDRVRSSLTVLRDDETFGFARLEPTDDFGEFQRRGLEEIERAKRASSLDPARDQDDLVYHTVLPWIRFTSFTNPLGSHDDSIPRLAFGRCSPEGDRHVMPVAIEVHHGLVDGLDVARFLESFQRRLTSLDRDAG